MNVPYLHVSETKLMLQVKADLDRHEGFREYAYPDPLSKLGRRYRDKKLYPWGYKPAREIMAGIPNAKDEDGAPWTYGFGFTHCVTPDSRIHRIAAERMLEGLILEQNIVLGEKLPWVKEASFVTKTVLINMAFNLGLRSLLKFKNSLGFIKAMDYKKAAHNLKQSLWYTQVGSRAEELVKRIETQTIEPQHKAGDTING
jgi:GH24 family phage-related lysozyme (muramidase)